MRICRTICICLFLLCCGSIGKSAAAELDSPLDLVTSDVAICVEVPHLSETWNRVQAGRLAGRLRGFSPLLKFLDSPGVRHWEAVEDHVVRQTGAKLSTQLRRLFARSLVIAIYVPGSGDPRGILIGEAEDADAIGAAMSTWSKLEPGGSVTNKLHNGKKYFQRKKDPGARDSAYIAVSDRWFAVSDHESMIHDVIDRFVLLTAATSEAARDDSLSRLPAFVRSRKRLSRDGIAYVHINARPWDRGLEEASQQGDEPFKVIDLWKHVSSISACLRAEGGLVCESEINLEVSNLSSDWSKLVETASSRSTWIPRIPNGALLAVAGRLEIMPLLDLFVKQISVEDPAGFEKARRIGRSVFGGTDILSSVVPALARDFGGYLTVRRDGQRSQISFDGAVGFVTGFPASDKLDEGLESMLRLLAIYLSAESPDVVTVERRQNDGISIRSLSDSARYPIAYGMVHESPGELVVAGSEAQLIRALKPLAESEANKRFIDHSDRFFPGMNQLVWFDTAETRQILSKHGSELASSIADGSRDEGVRISRRFEQVLPFLGLVDSLFISGKVASDHIRVVFGCGLDSDSAASR